jgi:hypothetical protein
MRRSDSQGCGNRQALSARIEHLVKPEATGMAMLRRGRAKSDLARAKNKRAKGLAEVSGYFDLGTACFAIIAAIFWFISAAKKLPKISNRLGRRHA